MASLSPFWDFFDLAINQLAKTELSSLQVIYYFESLFNNGMDKEEYIWFIGVSSHSSIPLINAIYPITIAIIFMLEMELLMLYLRY
ncbi:hypothetical protein XNC1_0724 [Xenorhabdus nematophila ATCC 19061]|uniref:Uncharacterized protein n=1 Tax=Xenorhabdus nematophila (strain ATCC 19061 / DSM 3370 / CCUG 14189 / LMG 1036 / NCIMB 9965 / AN6) TaxID=406817 RepID=D3VJN9_XENNA|nr:hypothetical protein [Xenorhabdus nematophila]CBJ88795.1 hypothetical protein XNC1_0724 [Xenorhabdus nematophila ATCC 19061]CEK21709.1 hypothetical protein XNC2_0713 [Xenorhabdus nematophila AN6/1]